jgi:hypothetical protein
MLVRPSSHARTSAGAASPPIPSPPPSSSTLLRPPPSSGHLAPSRAQWRRPLVPNGTYQRRRPLSSSGVVRSSPTAYAPNVAARSRPIASFARAQRRRPLAPNCPLAPNGVVHLHLTISSARAQQRRPLAPNDSPVRARDRRCCPLAPNGAACSPARPNSVARSRPVAPPRSRPTASLAGAQRRCPLASSGAACSRQTTLSACVQRSRLLASNGVASSRPTASPARAQRRRLLGAPNGARNVAACLRPAAVSCPPLCLRTLHFSLYGTWRHVHPVVRCIVVNDGQSLLFSLVWQSLDIHMKAIRRNQCKPLETQMARPMALHKTHW